MKNFRSTIQKATLIALTTIMSGCSSWAFYAVESNYSSSEHEKRPAEIIKTATYLKNKKKIKRVAVRAADGCANETTSQSKGEAISLETVLLKSNCGHEMAILERSIAKAGYSVISWKIIDSRANSKKKSAVDIAKDMKADILLQINSMERLITGSGADLRLDRRFYVSNKRREIKEVAKVNQVIKKQILNHAQKVENSHRLNHSKSVNISVNLNVTAADVNTGEAIWFYEWTLSEEAKSDLLKTTSFSACKKNKCKSWMPRRRVTNGDELSSGTSQAVTRVAFEDIQRAKHNQLIKKLVGNMIKNLKSG